MTWEAVQEGVRFGWNQVHLMELRTVTGFNV